MVKRLIIVSALLLALLAPLSAHAVERYEMLMLGDSDKYVLTLQKELHARGYLKSEPTGYFGTETQEALIRYQKTAGILPDGKAGPTTLQKLYGKYYIPIPSTRVVVNKLQDDAGGDVSDDSSDSLRKGDTDSAVKDIQMRLKELGYYQSSDFTTYFGSLTEDAVRAFQKKNDLCADGVVGKKTYDAIFDEDAVPMQGDDSPANAQSEQVANNAQGTQAATQTSLPQEDTTYEVSAAEDSISELIAFAQLQLGKRYRSATAGPNTFDCSGFVYYCLRHLNIKASRSSSDQGSWKAWTRIAAKGSLLPGDVVCFTSPGHPRSVGHTGLYIGGGKFIHSSSTKGVIISDLTVGEYLRRFLWGMRVPELYAMD